MVLIGNFIIALSQVLNAVLWAAMWLIVARAILSWVSPDPFNPIVRFIHNVTEPVLRPIRQRFPVTYGGMDFSPMIVFFIIMFLNAWLVPSLREMGKGLTH